MLMLIIICVALFQNFQNLNLLFGTCRDNICHVVEAPAGIPEKMKKLATSVAEKAIKSLEGAGVFAVELFLTNDNQVCLNIYVYVL
jgi:phosphoribosylaminoimidazole carboxylase (NCAIR synthetase)